MEHTADREVQRDDSKRNQLKCTKSRPCHLSLRVRQIYMFLAVCHLRQNCLQLVHDGEGGGWLVVSVRLASRIIVFFLKLSVTERSRDDVSFLLRRSIITWQDVFP